MELQLTERQIKSLEWLLIKGMEITNSDNRYDDFSDILREIELNK